MARIFLCLALVVCAGCGRQKQTGFEPGNVHYSQMAVDSAYRLNASYLPAKTSFALSDSGNDVFDASLSAKLREMGFSVTDGAEVSAAIPLKPNLIFLGEREAVVVLQIGDSQLQRGFDLLDADVSPNSYWMARRNGDA